ncbi:MAG: hypothetical protein Ta2B_02300 [Termitinemataceae bacterium]|nr:MAG: hypothetical protein Ta2B_02300 [Termitinemataceae bacterium]
MNLMLGIAITAFIAAVIVFIIFFWKLNKGDEKPVRKKRADTQIAEGVRGANRVCPICAALFLHGETVQSKRFPSTGRFDRLLHISGCPHCLNGERQRLCPICGSELSVDDYLVARIWERPGKSHVHVSGCIHCCMGH